MNTRQQHMLARFTQILAFLDANADVIPTTLVVPQRQLLASAVARITSFTQAQLVKGGDIPASQSVASARSTLRDTYIRQLSTIGLHSLAGQNPGDPSVPNAVQIFTMPATRGNSRTIVDSAKAMLAVATHHRDVMLRPVLAARPELLTQWQTVKRSAGGPKLGKANLTPAAATATSAKTTPGQATPPAAVESAR